MGSTGSQLHICPYCATEIKSSSDKKDQPNASHSQSLIDNSNKQIKKSNSNVSSLISELPSHILLCQRCHGMIKKVNNNGTKVNKNNNNNNNPINSTITSKNKQFSKSSPQLIQTRRYIEHLNIYPFNNNISDILDQKMDIDDKYLISKYISPFFNKNPDISIHRGSRIIIRNIEFKIFSCYPPKGFINKSTKFHLKNHLNGSLLKLNYRPIKTIHILATKQSINTYYKRHNISSSGAANDQIDNNQLLQTHILPYLYDNDQSFYIKTKTKKIKKKLKIKKIIIDQKIEEEQDDDNIVKPTPKNTKNTTDIDNKSDDIQLTIKNGNTQNDNKSDIITDGNTVDQKVNKPDGIQLTINKSDFITDGNTQNAQTPDNSDDIDFRQKRHLMENEIFISKGVEWIVMKCVPSDGYIDSDSDIKFIGDAIPDIKSIVIRPIYESLPQYHRNCTPSLLKKYYLDPYFLGNNKFIDNTREIRIFGVKFVIRNALPFYNGIVSCSTVIDYAAVPIKLQELVILQQMEDIEYAKKIEEEEKNRGLNLTSSGGYRSFSLADINEMYHRYEDNNNSITGDPFLDFLRRIGTGGPTRQRPKPRQGLNKDQINILPIYTYIHSDKLGVNDRSCRICIEFYKNGDSLRILPCFHKYHKDCVDQWLKMSTKCPICKTSVIKQLIGNRNNR